MFGFCSCLLVLIWIGCFEVGCFCFGFVLGLVWFVWFGMGFLGFGGYLSLVLIVRV